MIDITNEKFQGALYAVMVICYLLPIKSLKEIPGWEEKNDLEGKSLLYYSAILNCVLFLK